MNKSNKNRKEKRFRYGSPLEFGVGGTFTRKGLYRLNFQTDTMLPTIHRTSELLLSGPGLGVMWGEVYLVAVKVDLPEGKIVTLGRMGQCKDESKFQIYYDNPRFPPLTFNFSDLIVYGRVRFAGYWL